jgi:hypothetical protein
MPTSKKRNLRFDRLVGSLEEVRAHIAAGHFTGRINNVTVGAQQACDQLVVSDKRHHPDEHC